MCIRDRLYAAPPRVGPRLPVAPRSLVDISKGISGLADVPREWYLRLARALKEEGWTALRTDPASYQLRIDGVLVGILVGHVGGLLMGGDDRAK
eukprot:13110077-Alexandrium_andersonii.AAC.1